MSYENEQATWRARRRLPRPQPTNRGGIRAARPSVFSGGMADTPERRLAAILFSDIVGYTALMAADEERGLRVRERHRALVRPAVERHRGEPVEVRGDECLSVFPSALDAVQCALALQDEVQDEPDLELHLGIHVGDVVRVGEEISGDGVNVASRLCALTEGGGLCVSSEVRQAVRNQPGSRRLRSENASSRTSDARWRSSRWAARAGSAPRHCRTPPTRGAGS